MTPGSGLTARQQRLLDRVKVVLESQPVSTPTQAEIAAELYVPIMAVREILRLGVNLGQVICLEEGVYYASEQLERLSAHFGTDRTLPLTVSAVCEELSTTRKYAIALLKHFTPE